MHKGLSRVVSDDIEDIIASDLPWDNLRDKSVLIAGANGFIPSYIVYTLVALNDVHNFNINIIGLVRNRSKALNHFKGIGEQYIEIVEQDVCCPILYEGKIDIIIHAASQASPKYYAIDPIGTINANTIGTYNLLHLAYKKSVEGLLFFSSSEVYGSVEEKYIPTKEKDFGYLNPLNVRSCYAEGKRAGETMCISWFHQLKVPVKIVRPFHTYGPGMNLQDGRVYADFVSNVVENKNIELKSAGNAMRAFCYISDATKGFFTILLKGKNGEAYNIGNPEQEISIFNLAEKLVGLFPEKKLKVVRHISDSSNYLVSTVSRNCPDIAKVKELGWIPETTIEKGFRRTVESYI